MSLPNYHVVRDRLNETGPSAWDAEGRVLVTFRRAVVMMVVGTASLVAIVALMVFKPS